MFRAATIMYPSSGNISRGAKMAEETILLKIPIIHSTLRISDFQ
jgi:hypothetical protein